MKFYVAAAMADALKAYDIGETLSKLGHEWTYDWTSLSDKDNTWSAEYRQKIAEAEIDGVRRADIVVAILPGGRGMHSEVGAAMVMKKRVLLVGDVEPKFSLFYEHSLITKIIGDNLLCRIIDEMK